MTAEPTPERSNGATPPPEWDAKSYHTVSEPQFEWGKQVLSTLALAGNETVLDAGAGTGRLTALLTERLARGRAVALDRSTNMAHKAAETLAPFGPRSTIAVADLSNLPFASIFDVVFSTATFHWVLDHDRLFGELAAVLRPGGRLHAQCGGARNLDRVHHRAHDLMTSAPFARYFNDWQEPWEFADAGTTRDRLARAGFTRIETSIVEAPVTFANAADFRAFISTVVMRPFLARLPDDASKEGFLDGIVDLAGQDAPAYTLDYWRLNIVAVRG